MFDPVLVVGALGNVGAEVVKSLLDQGQPVRAADLSEAAIRERFGGAVEAIPFDFTRPELYPPALVGARRMFLMRPPQISDVKRVMFPFLEAARAAGVERVAFLSLIGIEQNRRVPHYALEEWLRGSGLSWTFLRASFFMQNLSGTHRADIRDRSELYVPVGRGKTSFVDVRDLGAVAALTLAEARHEQKAYDLTGPEALDYYQVAEILTGVLGRRITYRDPLLPAFVLRTVRGGTPLPSPW